MANAVRALLFLWNGWMDDCVKAAESAPEKERLYIQALCDRAEGEPAAAKSSFQKLEAHVVFPKLTAYATEAITTGASGQVKRLLDMIQMTQEWEAYTFVDLIELARADKLDSAGEQIVRQLQCREFELLFAHCFEGATGEAIKETEAVTVAHKRRPQAAPSTRRRPASTPASTTSASKPTPSKTPSAAPTTQGRSQPAHRADRRLLPEVSTLEDPLRRAARHEGAVREVRRRLPDPRRTEHCNSQAVTTQSQMDASTRRLLPVTAACVPALFLWPTHALTIRRLPLRDRPTYHRTTHDAGNPARPRPVEP